MNKTHPPETPSIHAQRVLVPIANPATASDLLRLAWKLANTEHGHVLALFVTLSSDDTPDDVLEEIETLVEKAKGFGIPVELVTRTAPSVARGILDAAREEGATLMVLGFRAPPRGRFELGAIVEEVARTTPCDLVIYRRPLRRDSELDDIEHVILPLNGSDNSRVAARLGLVLAETYDVQPVAYYVETQADLPTWFGEARLASSLSRVGEVRHVQRHVIEARDVVSGILSRVDANDLVVIGYSESSPLDRWIFGNVAQRMLAQAVGPVIVTKRATPEDEGSTEWLRHWLQAHFPSAMTPAEQAEVNRRAVETSRPGVNFLVQILFASVIACLGLLLSNASVIIAAMLLSPLMSPLMSFSIGLVQGQLRVMRTSAVTALSGMLVVLLMGLLIGTLVPVELPTPEMSTMGQPSLLDMGVALAAGAAGAFATARRDIPSALVGVAIASTMVPPLCTAGMAIAFGESDLATGAGLLFLTNIVSISVAGAAVFFWMGLRPKLGYARWHWLVWLLILVALAIPLGSAFFEVTRQARQTGEARRVLEAHFEEAEVIDVEVRLGTTPLEVNATVQSQVWLNSVDVIQAEHALEDRLGRDVSLEITNWLAISP
ncbi:MAG: DUF389 domain-containing protein [Chloroflexi bacterium]|nr:DUF389 domain-containing protein [Chloroflexota bacterium]